MQDMTIFDWLAAYRPSSPIYDQKNYPHLDDAFLGASIRLHCAMLVHEHMDEALEHGLNSLTASLAVNAAANGLSQYAIKIEHENGAAWHLLIKRADAAFQVSEPNILSPAPISLEPSLSKARGPSANYLGELWEAVSRTHPFLLRRPDAEIGGIARSVLRCIHEQAEPSEIVNIVSLSTFLILQMEEEKTTSITNLIENLQDNEISLGAWSLFLSDRENFGPLISSLETAISSGALQKRG